MNDPLTPEERAALADCDGYLSRCRPYLNRLQRERRARTLRIDYEPGDRRTAELLLALVPNRTWCAVLDRIVTEWAEDRDLLPPE